MLLNVVYHSHDVVFFSTMAVPKRKTSPSKRGTRRAHNALKALNIIVDPKTGKHHLSHMMSEDGVYRGRNVLKKS